MLGRRDERRNPPPTIHFRQNVDSAGFSSSATANEADADATKIVRELIQNSVDAARENGRDRTEVRFAVENLSLTDCPGIQQLREAYDLALVAQRRLAGGELPDVARHAAERIGNALQSDTVEVLCVSDNGVGLTLDTMKNILGDGQSGKAATEGGSHGYGHLTVIPASDLRLVYYGGIDADGARVASGHCILAPFEDREGRPRTRDGYLVDELKADLFDPYVFPTGAHIPDLIAGQLDRIEAEWGSGAAVIVPSFNFFRDGRDSLWGSIRQAAATNFLVPFLEGGIRIEAVLDGETNTLDSASVKRVIDEGASQRRSRFLPGVMARECMNVILTGEDILFETSLGTVRGKLVRHPPGRGTQRIDLWRNGMWITHSGKSPRFLPRLQKSAFDGYEPFHLCLLLRSTDGDIHRLVRSAEPTLHDELDVGRLPDNDAVALRQAFSQIQDQLKGRLGKVDATSFRMDGILSLPIGGTGPGGDGGIHAGEWEVFDRRPRSQARGGAVVDVGREPGSEPENGGGKPDNPSNGGGAGGGTRTGKRPGNPALFHAVPVMTAPGQCEMEIIPGESAPVAEVRFMLDESMDATCQQMDGEPLVHMRNIRLDGETIPENMRLRDENGNILGVLIDGFSKDRRYRLSFGFEPPDGVAIDRVALKVEVVKRQPASVN